MNATLFEWVYFHLGIKHFIEINKETNKLSSKQINENRTVKDNSNI
jgi:hypothetical protein